MGEDKAEIATGKVEASETSTAEKEILGTWSAMQYVDGVAKNRRAQLDDRFIRETHRRLMQRFPQTGPGRYRDFPVLISQTAKMPVRWREVEGSMEKFGSVLASSSKNLSGSLEKIESVIQLAAWAHKQLVDIHPFVDGNGRVARLMVDAIFKRAGLHYIIDWGASHEEYKKLVRRVDHTGDVAPFEGFLAGKLAERYKLLQGHLTKKHREKELQRVPVFQNLINTSNELVRIARVRSATS